MLQDEPEVLTRIRAVLASSLEAPADGEGDGAIKMHITPSIHRNYEQRKVFLQYRPERAAKILPTLTTVFFVTMEEAEEVLRDAQEQRKRNDGPRGQAKAFTGLIYALEASIKAERFRGCIDFPGAEKVIAELRAASAIFEVGDRVAVWYDDEVEGKPVTITSPYDYYTLRADDGTCINRGERVNYCQGYKARRDDGEEYFYYAWQLAPVGKSYGHSRLVK